MIWTGIRGQSTSVGAPALIRKKHRLCSGQGVSLLDNLAQECHF
jgi:hypothetical protein